MLERRAAVLRDNLAGLERDLEGEAARLPRVTLLETEYLRAVTAWSHAELAEMARSFLPD